MPQLQPPSALAYCFGKGSVTTSGTAKAVLSAATGVYDDPNGYINTGTDELDLPAGKYLITAQANWQGGTSVDGRWVAVTIRSSGTNYGVKYNVAGATGDAVSVSNTVLVDGDDSIYFNLGSNSGASKTLELTYTVVKVA